MTDRLYIKYYASISYPWALYYKGHVINHYLTYHYAKASLRYYNTYTDSEIRDRLGLDNEENWEI